ncbi:hypothetical protein Y032_0009g493 [Ancylostoma ceylanicum]|nr:hypothetical protein Y032_0009g493 [Ancylostoma ceylanicum]
MAAKPGTFSTCQEFSVIFSVIKEIHNLLIARTRKRVNLIDRRRHDVFTRRYCCGGQPAQLEANPAPAPRSGEPNPIHSGVFVICVTFALHYGNQRGE